MFVSISTTVDSSVQGKGPETIMWTRNDHFNSNLDGGRRGDRLSLTPQESKIWSWWVLMMLINHPWESSLPRGVDVIRKVERCLLESSDWGHLLTISGIHGRDFYQRGCSFNVSGFLQQYDLSTEYKDVTDRNRKVSGTIGKVSSFSLRTFEKCLCPQYKVWLKAMFPSSDN